MYVDPCIGYLHFNLFLLVTNYKVTKKVHFLELPLGQLGHSLLNLKVINEYL